MSLVVAPLTIYSPFIHETKLQQQTMSDSQCFSLRESPLVLYIFTPTAEVQNLFINGTQSGGLCVNDTIMHYAGKNPTSVNPKVAPIEMLMAVDYDNKCGHSACSPLLASLLVYGFGFSRSPDLPISRSPIPPVEPVSDSLLSAKCIPVIYRVLFGDGDYNYSCTAPSSR